MVKPTHKVGILISKIFIQNKSADEMLTFNVLLASLPTNFVQTIYSRYLKFLKKLIPRLN